MKSCPVIRLRIDLRAFTPSLFLSVFFLLNETAFAQNGKFGINTVSPLATLNVLEGDVLFNSADTSAIPAPPPVSGAGVRMMWYPDKAAFRAGKVTGTHWNKDSIGVFSVAMGINNRAKGVGSVALGGGNRSTGNYSTTFGTNNQAKGLYSMAGGAGSTATGTHSVAIGYLCHAEGNYSFAMGNNCEAMGNESVAGGYSSEAWGIASTAFGFATTAESYGTSTFGILTKARGQASTAIGRYTQANGFASTVIGLYNDTLVSQQNSVLSTTPLFIIGNGSEEARSNALVVRKDGNVGIGTSSPSNRLHIAGGYLVTDDRVGIGTSTPARNLEISGSNDQVARITSTTGDISALEFLRTGNGLGDWRLVDSNGNFYLGRSGNDFVTVTEIVRITPNTLAPGADNDITLGTSTFRWATVYAVNGTIQTSDANDKESILPISSGLQTVMQLKPVSYVWKDENIDRGKKHLGFLAQDLLEVLPEVVGTHEWKEISETGERTWSESERLGVRYSEIIPVLVKAIQDQQQIIGDQRLMIDQLSQRVTALELSK
jgi:hypothetical protein